MEHTAPTPSRPAPPDPAQDRPAPTMPGRLAALLQVVRVLLGHGRRLVETVPERAATVEFATLAAVCGTYNLPIILTRLQRGILRAMALERYLLARGAKGREIAFVEPRTRTPAKPAASSPGAPASDEAASEVPGGRAESGHDETAASRAMTMGRERRRGGPARSRCGWDQRLENNASCHETNSHGTAFETPLSARPRNRRSRGSGETGPRAGVRPRAALPEPALCRNR